MNIFIVSLKNNNPRRAKIKQVLEANDVPFEFFDAIDGRLGLPVQYENKIDRKKTKKRLYREMNDGEYACALSFAQLFEKIVREHISDTIILEDDAILTPDFFKLIKNKALEKSDIDMAFLFHYKCYVKKKQYFLNDIDIPYQKIAFMPVGATGFYINLSVAKALNNATKIVSHTADFPLALEISHKVVAFSKRIVQHPNTPCTQIKNRRYNKVFRKLSRRVLVLLGLQYFYNKQYYGNFVSFVKRTYLRRLGFYDNISYSIGD